MIRTLDGSTHERIKADVLVIGAGTVGLVAAVKLAEQRKSVVCVETGLERQDADEHPLNEVEHRSLVYDGAAHGRFRCLGGTSTRWGGALIPFARGDLDPTRWPIAYDEMLRFLPEVETMFGLHAGSYSAEGLGGFASPDFLPRLAKWPPFPKRNVANLTASACASSANPDVWLNATATGFRVTGDRLSGVTARSPDGGELVVEADEVIFAAGAIETTRLLLVLDQQNDGQVFAPDDQLGRYFSDHLSVPIGQLEPLDRAGLNRITGFRFESGGAMRNVRFELTDTTALRQIIPPCFAHIVFASEESGGFNALRELFRCLQRRRPPPVSVLARLVRSAPWLARAVWWRLVEKRLLYPEIAELQLHLVTEQLPQAQNRITLSPNRRDAFGLPLAVIDWNIAEADSRRLDAAADAFVDAWENSALAALARVKRWPRADLEQSPAAGIFHPVGSTRMGFSAETSVVDSTLRPFRLRNATVLSTSVLPASGGANPTMMLLLLALRAVERLAQPAGRSEAIAG